MSMLNVILQLLLISLDRKIPNCTNFEWIKLHTEDSLPTSWYEFANNGIAVLTKKPFVWF